MKKSVLIIHRIGYLRGICQKIKELRGKLTITATKNIFSRSKTNRENKKNLSYKNQYIWKKCDGVIIKSPLEQTIEGGKHLANYRGGETFSKL